jgi:hypothetical protein
MTTTAVFRLLALLCLLSLAGIAAVALFVRPQWTAPNAQRPDMASLRPQPVTTPVTSVSLLQIGQRPLFFESRRPITAAAQAAPAPDLFPDAELVGLFGSGSEAGVIVKANGEVSRIRVGMEWSGWRLKSVDPVAVKAVFVLQGRDEHEIRLTRQPQQGGMTAAFERPVFADTDPPADPDELRQDEDGVERDDLTDPGSARILIQERRAAARAEASRSSQPRITPQRPSP